VFIILKNCFEKIEKQKTKKEGGQKMKKLLTVLVTAALVLSFLIARPLSVNAAGFKDVPDSYWAKGQIDYLVTKGIVAGYPDGTFKPAEAVTREQFAKMVCIAKGLKEYKPATSTFKDVASSRWSFGFVEAAVKAGYIKGYTDGTFKPERSITREELAVLGVRVIGKETEANSIKESFVFANDEDKISSWAVGAMTIAVRPKVQMLKWDDLRNIRPKTAATRAECAHAIYSILVPPGSIGKKTLINLSEEGPENFFPAISDSAYTAQAATYIYGAMVTMKPGGTIYPDMVKAIPSLSNGLLKLNNAEGTVETTWILRKGLKWSDGQPVTVDDIIFAYNMYMNDAVQIVSRYPYDYIQEIKKIDTYTLYVKWNILDNVILTGLPIYPKHILGPIYDEDPALINSADYGTKNPIHCGPYIVDKYVAGQYTTYKKNPNWYGGEPVLDSITDRVIQDTNTQFANLLAGGIDTGSAILTLDLAKKVDQQMAKIMDVYYNVGSSFGIMQLNLTSEWFKDVRVRQAFRYAVDWKEVARRAAVGDNPAISFVPAGTWAAKDVLSQYVYNVDKANELLDAAGWKWNADHTLRILPSGTQAVLKVPYAQGAAFREREVTILQPYLLKVGIKLEHGPMDFNALLDSETKGTFIMTLHGISYSEYDPVGSMVSLQTKEIPTAENGYAGQNVNRYSNPEMDALVTQALNEGFKSQTDRIPALNKIQEIYGRDLPFILLEHRMYPDVVRKGLQGWEHFFAGTAYYNWNCPYWFWDTNIG